MKRKCKLVKVVSLHGEGIIFKDSMPPHKLLKNFHKDNHIIFKDCTYYDLYIVNDQDIVIKGDWFVDNEGNVHMCDSVDGDMIIDRRTKEYWNFLDCTKVIGSTNTYVTDSTWIHDESEGIVRKIPKNIVDSYIESNGEDDKVIIEFDMYNVKGEDDYSTYVTKSDEDNNLIGEMDKKEHSFNERQLEMVFCLGILNQGNVTMDQLHEQTPELKHKFEMAKRFVLENS